MTLPIITGDELPLRTEGCGAILVWWDFGGEIGDFGATARTLSGESGVLHCISFAMKSIEIENNRMPYLQSNY